MCLRIPYMYMYLYLWVYRNYTMCLQLAANRVTLSVCCFSVCLSVPVRNCVFHYFIFLSLSLQLHSQAVEKHGQRDEGTPPPVCYRNIQSTNERIRRVTRYSFVKPHTICKKKLIEWINLHTNPLIVSYTQCLDASGRRTLYIHNIHVVVL